MFNKLNFKLKCLLFCQNLLFFNCKTYSKCNNCCCCKGKNDKLNKEDDNKLNNNDNDKDFKKNEDNDKLNNEDNDKDFKQILSDVLLLFSKVEDKNNKLFDNKIDLGITREQIYATKDVKKLEEFKTILEKKSSEIENLEWVDEEETYDIEKEDTPICNNIDSFKNEFNNRKKLIKLKNAELLKKLQDNNPTEDQYNHYFDVYSKMTNDIFTHEVSVDLTIYIYILDLIGIIDALNNIIKKEKLQYWMFCKTFYDPANLGGRLFISKDCNLKFEEKDDNNLDVYLKYGIEEKNTIEYNSAQLDIDGEKFKYLRCSGCTESNCISCKLRNFLKNEKLLDFFYSIFNEQSKNSTSIMSLTVKNFIYLSIKNNFKNNNFYKWNNKTYDNKIDDKYELSNKISCNLKKCVLLEWAITMEFLDRFVKEISDEDIKFDIYRSISFNSGKGPGTIKNVDFFESTSMFAPVYHDNNYLTCYRANYYKINDFKTYRCLFSYIISPQKETMFTAHSGSVDHEQEIGYIPINQQWVRINELKNGDTADKLKNFSNRCKLIDDLIIKFLIKNLKKDAKYNKYKKATIHEKSFLPWFIPEPSKTYDL